VKKYHLDNKSVSVFFCFLKLRTSYASWKPISTEAVFQDAAPVFSACSRSLNFLKKQPSGTIPKDSERVWVSITDITAFNLNFSALNAMKTIRLNPKSFDFFLLSVSV